MARKETQEGKYKGLVQLKRQLAELPQANEKNMAVTEAIISLSKKLIVNVITEEVETEAQQKFLRLNDCNEYQEFHFSRSLAHDAFIELFSTYEKRKKCVRN